MLSLIFILITCLSAIRVSSNQTSIYEILRDHGLPMGLLPKGISEYSFDPKTERFEVHMDQECNAKFESELHYSRNISGVFSVGSIRKLSGIKAQELFLWFDVKAIRVDMPSTGVIYFDVGVARKQFSLSLFENPKECVVVTQPGPEIPLSSISLHVVNFHLRNLIGDSTLAGQCFLQVCRIGKHCLMTASKRVIEERPVKMISVPVPVPVPVDR
ncbi:hypothetical protein ACFE04_000313 [Oxalis oulophora]